MMHKRVEPDGEIHGWYSKEAYLLTYKEKLQLVKGRQFWKVEPSQAMLPPDTVKQVGRPKVKRNRELDEARKRIGQWSQSRKGTQMTCSNCGEPNHNARGCYKPKAAGNSSQSSTRTGASGSQTQKSSAMDSDQESQIDVAPVVVTQEFTPYGPEVDNEEDPPLRPMIISETQSRIERGNLRGPTN
uniref:Uncharacterized protein LOC104243926 n=1 Tax=Nicotiana sylvestris TaxID=4096 RepID=A0A1U7Y2Z9_NICSY|nr:PREDICTED: uncharacterized protein LOC104243926 [Nicotiana sylvestris]XP_009797509.1 PREDICTED: uncharacterized protein LOC104243926 [Nicotiana sylvestris]